MGYFQDITYTEKDNTSNNNNFLNGRRIKYLRYIIGIIFWSYLIISSYLYLNSPQLLWQKLFSLIIIVLIMVSTLQMIFKKRFWCINLCPLGRLMNLIIYFKKYLKHTDD
jgi:polyferredoxin